MQIYPNNPLIRRSDKVGEVSLINGKATVEFATGNGDSFSLAFKEQRLGLYLEPGTVKVNIPDRVLKDAGVSGSKSTQQMGQWFADWKKMPIYEITSKAQDKWLEATTDALKAVAKEEYDPIKAIYDQERMSFNTKWIISNPDADVTSEVLKSCKGYMPDDQLAAWYEGLNERAKGNLAGRYIKYNIDSLFVNGTAPAFTQADTDGHLVKLADFRGKYVLLDFWASWCLPRRAENPYLLKLYNRFKDRNFTILGVSLDSERKPWLEAIKKDQVFWTQVSELNGFDNSLITKYAIKSVPANVLIAPDGKIIAKNIALWSLMEILERLDK
ncbi:redoxin domain-containing protein [Pedobacter sp. LMG 31462]|uniref:Redoxin domain-containing protein n=2 Tax=Pedobacter gandavensis TaxID=2679963 RepID=A0ABR6ETS9_9SPHI|nr:redoxin domain-containing protein [Pedobacter gandavensis]